MLHPQEGQWGAPPERITDTIVPFTFSLLVREAPPDLADQRLDLRLLAQALRLAVVRTPLDAEVVEEALDLLEQLGRLLLREEVDLEVEVGALVRLPAHPVLADQDEDGEQHPLRRDDQRQDAEREGVERLQRGPPQVHHEPDGEQEQMEDDERHRPHEAGEEVADPLPQAPALHRSLLEADDFLDVLADALS